MPHSVPTGQPLGQRRMHVVPAATTAEGLVSNLHRSSALGEVEDFILGEFARVVSVEARELLLEQSEGAWVRVRVRVSVRVRVRVSVRIG